MKHANGNLYPQLETNPFIPSSVAVGGSTITAENVCGLIAEKVTQEPQQSSGVFPLTELPMPTAIVPTNHPQAREKNPIINLASLKQLIRHSILHRVVDISGNTLASKWRVSLWLPDGSTRLYEVGAENQLEAFIYAVLECAHDTHQYSQEVISIQHV